MKILGIIPARYGSTRFPGKPLALIHGKSMIQRVFERAFQSQGLSEVVVATDDQRIFDHVIAFGGKVVMTATTHPSGTDRCAETLSKSGNFDLVINIQGDEPYIHPEQIDLLINSMVSQNAQIGTLVKGITTKEELFNPNIPKVVRDNEGFALYFSRQPIPFSKDSEVEFNISQRIYFKHIGIYGYQASVLPLLAALKPGKLEKSESLEQLRWLENGYRI